MSPDGSEDAGSVTAAQARYLEAVGRLAAELTARGEVEAARELLAQAARVVGSHS
jgi:hypothetical protein